MAVAVLALLLGALSVGTTVATGTGAVTTVTHVQTGPSIAPPRTAADARREARAATARARSDRLAWPLHGEVTGRFGDGAAGTGTPASTSRSRRAPRSARRAAGPS